CTAGSPWAATSAPLALTVAVGEPATDHGWVHFELKLAIPADALVSQTLGLGLRRINGSSGVNAVERFPYADDGAGPVDADVASWETLQLAYTQGMLIANERRVDGCCFPSRSIPGTD